MMSPRRIAVHFVGIVLVSVAVPAPARSEPFVSTFDRFGRHGEIDNVLAGKLLISELSCTACHTSDDDSLAPKSGPNLHDAPVRLSPDWIRSFVSAPHDVKPGTTMPDLLGGKTTQERQRIAGQLTAFLMSQSGELPVVEGSGVRPVPFQFWKKGNAERGKSLFHRVGCVACHQPDESFETTGTSGSESQLDRLFEELDPEELADMGLASAARRVHSVPQSNLPQKYSLQSLTHFLLAPAKFRPAGRMPELKLSATEAADIAAYLLGDAGARKWPPQQYDRDSVEAGRKLFGTLGCIQCHHVTGVDKVAGGPPGYRRLENLSFASPRTCLNPSQVDYALSPEQLETIRAAVESSARRGATERDTELDLTLLQLNCLACHERDGLGGVGRYRKKYFHTVDHVDLGDEGRLPPPLTGVGAKLTLSRLKSILAAKKADVRPHMHVRMPVFPSNQVAKLPQQFAAADEVDTSKPKEVFGADHDTAEIGRKLMDVGCVQCHAFRGQTLPGVVGVDLAEIQKRVHPRWFHDFLLNPGSLKARTRMPTFFPDGRSQHPGLLGGDPTKQIGAMWAYLSEVNQERLPVKIENARSQDFELVPSEAPIVLRTFVENVGTHAIAVGFPAGVHYVFDADAVKLAIGWRGRFVDAQGTWFIRFAPPANPLGDDLIRMPTSGLFPESHVTFRGYRLDSGRIPELLYHVDGHDITDRIVPDGEKGLLRTISVRRVDSDAAALMMTLNDGGSLRRDSEVSCTNENGLTVAIVDRDGRFNDSGTSKRVGQVERWMVKIDAEGETRIKVRYSW